MSQTSDQSTSEAAEAHTHPVTVEVNRKPVELPSHHITGLQVKEAAIAQGVQIQLDFQLTLEAHGKHKARTIEDNEYVTVTKDSKFSANDVDDDS